MSTSFTPGKDLILSSRVPAAPSLFTTFARGSFVKPSQFTQPVKAISSGFKPADFVGCFTEVFAAAAIDLDYDEPNAVVDAELEVVHATQSVHQVVLPVTRAAAMN
jgi:hypothetical protein